MVRPTTNALRLTFVHQAGKLQLQSRIGVNAVVPAAEPAGEHGFWAELRDPGDKPVFRRLLHDPMPANREVFSPDASRSVARAPGGRDEQVFSVLVPNLPEADSVALVSSHHEGVGDVTTKAAHAVAVEVRPADPRAPRVARTIARFQLDDNG